MPACVIILTSWWNCIPLWPPLLLHSYLILHYLLTSWCRILLEKLTGLQLVKKFLAFYGTRRFITALTSVRLLSLSWASPIQSTYPHPTSWRSTLILSSHLHLGLPSGLFPSGFPHQDPIRPPLLTHTCHMPSSSHSSFIFIYCMILYRLFSLRRGGVGDIFFSIYI